jgi:hypothetical protein
MPIAISILIPSSDKIFLGRGSRLAVLQDTVNRPGNVLARRLRVMRDLGYANDLDGMLILVLRGAEDLAVVLDLTGHIALIVEVLDAVFDQSAGHELVEVWEAGGLSLLQERFLVDVMVSFFEELEGVGDVGCEIGDGEVQGLEGWEAGAWGHCDSLEDISRDQLSRQSGDASRQRRGEKGDESGLHVEDCER